MAKLTSSKRGKLPKGEFAGPDRSFPIPDKKHAKLAIAMASRSERAGNISAGEETKIKERARAKLNGGGIAAHSSMDGTGMFDGDHKRKY